MLTNQKPDAIICDIDGTITQQDAWRDQSQAKFNENLKSLITSRDANGYPRTVIFLTARPEWMREETDAFLKKHMRSVQYKLFMRPEENEDEDYVMKCDTYVNEIYDNYNVIAAFDDKQSNIDMWMSMGVQAYLVSYLKR